MKRGDLYGSHAEQPARILLSPVKITLDSTILVRAFTDSGGSARRLLFGDAHQERDDALYYLDDARIHVAGSRSRRHAATRYCAFTGICGGWMCSVGCSKARRVLIWRRCGAPDGFEPGGSPRGLSGKALGDGAAGEKIAAVRSRRAG